MKAKNNNGTIRVVIENVKPEIDCGKFPIKRVIGESVTVTADIFTDGHDTLSAVLLYKRKGEPEWDEIPMHYQVNDRWESSFLVNQTGVYCYSIEGWVDIFKTWREDLEKKIDAGQDVEVDILIGAELIEKAMNHAQGKDREKLGMFVENLRKPNRDIDRKETDVLSVELSLLMDKYQERTSPARYEKELEVVVDREKALFSAWYELFPRSCASEPGRHGTFKDCERMLPRIAGMGFDVLYFPPIHPIGTTNRKGANNQPSTGSDDVGSPWAIGSEEGGHKSIHPQLGSIGDFEILVQKAKEHGLEVALDLAFQCSPDHLYVREHPEWFKWRPDGTVQYAENPPKKYEDVLPINFDTNNWRELWEELKSIVYFWIERGVRIFRVDNPHTKPFKFWQWLIDDIKQSHHEVIFLSEAFTRPKVMYHLAKVGFTQSYTYFTWRNTKQEFINYMTELTQTEVAEVFRPNLWPNTPDILPEHLQYGGRPAFITRLILASTLSSNYGIYGPAFELCVNEALPGKEEYADSEKYEIKHWELNKQGNLQDFITRVNTIRRENRALQMTRNLEFYETDNDAILAYGKTTDDDTNIIIVVVNLDFFHTRSGWITIPIDRLGIHPNQPYLVDDLLSSEKYIWQGDTNYIELNPQIFPGHIFRVRKRLRREADFDYFM